MWGPEVPGVIPEVVGRSQRGCPLVCEALGWGLPREGRGLLETPKAVAEIVATAVGWLLLFVLRPQRLS